jgi:Cu(I)/Ag(I) efflux system membrane fusion protein
MDAARRQLIGVKTAPVARKNVAVEIRAIGRVTYDETRLTDISLKYKGWLGSVFADYTGIRVTHGKPLFTIYSPELLSAQEEFLESLRRAGAQNERHRTLLETTRRRLRLWDLTKSQIARLAETQQPEEYVPILSPVTGTVIEKHVVAGSAVEPGMRLYRVADLSRVWVEANIYEADMPLVQVGQTAEQMLSYLPGQTFSGKVSYVYPYLDPTTRTGKVRLDVPNPNGTFKPDMYVNVALQIPFGQQLVVPEEAVVMAGKTNLVFLDRGNGRLQPQRLTLGRKVTDGFVVLDGLQAGDTVVTSGNFLIASESKLKAGVAKW